jgi:hypothetical protein
MRILSIVVILGVLMLLFVFLETAGWRFRYHADTTNEAIDRSLDCTDGVLVSDSLSCCL